MGLFSSQAERSGASTDFSAALPRPSHQIPSQDFSFIEDTEILDSAIYRSRANLGRKRGHRAPAIRPGGTLGLSEAADSDARLFQDSTEPRASRVPSSDEEVVEEPQSRRTRMSLGTKGLKVNLFPGLSPSALKAKLRPGIAQLRMGSRPRASRARRSLRSSVRNPARSQGWGSPSRYLPSQRSPQGQKDHRPTGFKP